MAEEEKATTEKGSKGAAAPSAVSVPVVKVKGPDSVLINRAAYPVTVKYKNEDLVVSPYQRLDVNKADVDTDGNPLIVLASKGA